MSEIVRLKEFPHYGDKTDNSVENLEWVTPKENINHAFNTGLNQCNMPVAAIEALQGRK